MTKIRKYPLNDSFRGTLKTSDSLVTASVLLKSIGSELDIGASETLVLVHASSFKDSVTDKDLRPVLDNLTDDRYRRVIKALLGKGYLVKDSTNKQMCQYSVSSRIRSMIAAITF